MTAALLLRAEHDRRQRRGGRATPPSCCYTPVVSHTHSTLHPLTARIHPLSCYTPYHATPPLYQVVLTDECSTSAWYGYAATVVYFDVIL